MPTHGYLIGAVLGQGKGWLVRACRPEGSDPTEEQLVVKIAREELDDHEAITMFDCHVQMLAQVETLKVGAQRLVLSRTTLSGVLHAGNLHARLA